MEIINNYSMIWSGVLLLGLAAFLIFRKGIQLQKSLLLIVIGAVLVGGWIVLRPERASTTELAQFKTELGQERSVLLELQSPY